MALTSALLDSELLSIANSHPSNEASAIAAFADAFHNYMLSSNAGAPIVPALALPAKSAMIAAMVGLNSSGAISIQSGVVAYWAALNVPGVWGATIVPTTPPPAIATLASALSAVFASNTTAKLDSTSSCNAIASVWHPIMLGGTATTPGPVVVPIL